MRIIAGEFRGRRLLAPDGDATRPITDRAKQSLFDILAPFLPGSRVYDCFAGTGSMGLECLSRGSVHATFFESDPSAIPLLQKNIQSLAVSPRSTVIPFDIFKWIIRPAATDRADILFLDPPFHFLSDRSQDLQRLAEVLAQNHLASAATVVFRHAVADALDLPPLRRYDLRAYGAMAIELMQRA